MSERKWPTGPFCVKRSSSTVDDEYDWAVTATIDGRPHVIAECFGRVAETIRPNAEATAHLFAAAPDLYEALLRIEPNIGWRSMQGDDPDQYYCEFCGEHDPDSLKIPHHDQCLVVVARSALSRAEGG